MIVGGADLESSSRINGSILFEALQKENLELLSTLLEAGANPNKPEYITFGLSLLDKSLDKDNPEILQLLLKYIKNIDLMKKALEYAKNRNKPNAIELISLKLGQGS